MQKVSISVPLRLHFNLIAMHQCSFRCNGGFGMAVDTGFKLIGKKSSIIEFKPASQELRPTLDRIVIKLEQIRKDLKLPHGLEACLYNAPLPHIGLGSGTAITLAAIEALLIINRYDYTSQFLQVLSGRGGTSGVGLHSYFTGGFVFDTGIQSENKPHLPSALVEPNKIPTLLFQKNYPFGDIVFLYPKGMFNNFGQQEADFFNAITPIAKIDSFEACYNAIFMVSASLADKNYETFIEAIDLIRNTAWKLAEVQYSGSNVKNIFSMLENEDVKGIGMSSMGPGVFIFSRKNKKVIRDVKEKYDLNEILLKPNNTGRKLEYV